MTTSGGGGGRNSGCLHKHETRVLAGLRGASNEKGGIQARREYDIMVSLNARNPEQVLTSIPLAHSQQSHTSTSGGCSQFEHPIARTSTTLQDDGPCRHPVTYLPSWFEDTPASPPSNDSGRERARAHPTITCGCRRSAASRITWNRNDQLGRRDFEPKSLTVGSIVDEHTQFSRWSRRFPAT